MIYIGVGSSIGNAEEIFDSAEKFLKKHGVWVIKKSSIYKNPPLGGVAKNEFSNGVWEIDFLKKTKNLAYSAQRLLKILKKCEVVHKRDLSAEKWSDRTLDLDILIFDDLVLKTKKLTIPHPEIANREFVLKPLKELNKKLSNFLKKT